MMDGGFEEAAVGLHKEWIDAERINDLFAKYGPRGRGAREGRRARGQPAERGQHRRPGGGERATP